MCYNNNKFIGSLHKVGENIQKPATIYRIDKQEGESVVWLSLIEHILDQQSEAKSDNDKKNTSEKEEVQQSDKNETPRMSRYPSRKKNPEPETGAVLPKGCAQIVKLCPSSYNDNGTIKQGYFALHVPTRVLWELTPGVTGYDARSKAKDNETFCCILPYRLAHHSCCFPKDASESAVAMNAYIAQRKDFQVGSTFPYTLSFHSMKKHATEDFQFARLSASKHPMNEMTSADKMRAKAFPTRDRLERRFCRSKTDKVETSGEMDEQKIIGEIEDCDGSL